MTLPFDDPYGTLNAERSRLERAAGRPIGAYEFSDILDDIRRRGGGNGSSHLLGDVALGDYFRQRDVVPRLRSRYEVRLDD